MSLLQPKQELSKARVQSDDAPAAKRLKSEADSNDDASSASVSWQQPEFVSDVE